MDKGGWVPLAPTWVRLYCEFTCTHHLQLVMRVVDKILEISRFSFILTSTLKTMINNSLYESFDTIFMRNGKNY